MIQEDNNDDNNNKKSSLVLSSELLNNLRENNNLNLIKRKQKNSNNYNYYITPNISFNLYKPKVLFIDTKFIVFEYKKHDVLNLYYLLKTTNDMIKYKLSYCTRIDLKTIYDIFSVREDVLTIRCYLPQNKGIYNIKFIDSITNETSKFSLPKKGVYLDQVHIDIRNIWEVNDKIGYNLEVRYIKN